MIMIIIDFVICLLHLARCHACYLSQVLKLLFFIIEVYLVKCWSLHIVEVLVACFERITRDINVLISVISLQDRHFAALDLFDYRRLCSRWTLAHICKLGWSLGTIASGVLPLRE